MATKTVKFKKDSISDIPNNKPGIYKILNKNNENVYTGSFKKGRAQERLIEHLPQQKDHIPGSKVKIEYTNTIKEAQNKEQNIISRSKPKFNKKGK